jgi:hypothetical protein
LKRGSDNWIKISRRFVFDEDSGVLTRERMQPRQMIVLQRGDSTHSLLASNQFQGAARYAFFSLRIETFEDPISFVSDEDGSWVSSTCDRVGN